MSDIEARLWVLEHLAAVTVRETTPVASIKAIVKLLETAQLKLACDPEAESPMAPQAAIPHLLEIFQRALEGAAPVPPAGHA